MPIARIYSSNKIFLSQALDKSAPINEMRNIKNDSYGSPMDQNKPLNVSRSHTAQSYRNYHENECNIL